MPATAKGPVVVLGLPFLRAYSTVFDAENHQLGFLKSARAESIAHAVVLWRVRVSLRDHRRPNHWRYGGRQVKRKRLIDIAGRARAPSHHRRSAYNYFPWESTYG